MKDFKFNPLDDKRMNMLAELLMAGIDDTKPFSAKNDLLDNCAPVQIVLERISSFNLPIELTESAILGISVFCDSPGRCVIYLIDILKSLDNQNDLYSKWKSKDFSQDKRLVTLGHICDSVYPLGILSNQSFGRYIDEYLKPKKTSWSEIY